jgi:hypothetical protein
MNINLFDAMCREIDQDRVKQITIMVRASLEEHVSLLKSGRNFQGLQGKGRKARTRANQQPLPNDNSRSHGHRYGHIAG